MFAKGALMSIWSGSKVLWTKRPYTIVFVSLRLRKERGRLGGHIKAIGKETRDVKRVVRKEGNELTKGGGEKRLRERKGEDPRIKKRKRMTELMRKVPRPELVL